MGSTALAYPDVVPATNPGAWAPTLDVVILNYNYARFLSDAVDSALAQRTPFQRVIVVDDGSTDTSMEILAGYGDRVRVVRIPNGGQLGAARVGLEHVSADYVYFLDSDDIAGRDLCGSVTQAAVGRPVKIQFQLAGVDEWGGPLESVFPSFPRGYSSEQMRLDNQRLGFDVCPPTSGNVYRTDVLRGLPLGSLHQRDFIDGTPTLVMPYLGTVVTRAEVLASYRVHGASDSQQARPSPEVLSRDLARFRRRWSEAEQLVPGLRAPAPASTFYEAEMELLRQALGERRPSARSVRDYSRHVMGSRMQARRKVMLTTWAASLGTVGQQSRTKLVQAKRSPVNRSGSVNSVLRAVLRRNRNSWNG